MRAELVRLDESLADETLYADQSRKNELKQLIKDQAAAKSRIEDLEWEWLEGERQPGTG